MLNRAVKIGNLSIVKNLYAFNLLQLVSKSREEIKPPPNYTGSEWADKYSIIPEDANKPGQWFTPNVPHTKFPMDAAANRKVRSVTIMGSAQGGKTQLGLNILGRRIHLEPCYMMIMHPDDTSARDFSEDKLEPFINDVKILSERIEKKKSGTAKKESILKKKIVGGVLRLGSALSKGFLRQRSAKFGWGDDIDSIEANQKEGDPITRLRGRWISFPDTYFELWTSTPSRLKSSRIFVLFNEGNKCEFFVKCVKCDHEFSFDPEKLEWEKDYDVFERVSKHYPKTAYYSCPNCSYKITEKVRRIMLRAGEYKPAEGHELIEEKISLRFSQMDSTLSSMKKIADSIIEAGDDPEKLEGLHNTVFGKPYEKIHGERPDPLKLMERIEDFMNINDMKLPNEVLMLTAAVDAQRGTEKKPARLEVKIMGWAEGYENWIIFRSEFPGSIAEKDVWFALDKFWERKYFRHDGVELKLALIGIDTGWGSEHIYPYLRKKRSDKRFFGIKGKGSYGAELVPKKLSLVDRGRVKLLRIGTNAAKDAIYTNFKIQLPKDYKTKPVPIANLTHFTKAFCDAEYFTQIASEEAVIKRVGMIQVVVYEKIDEKQANEALDLFVYNFGLAKLANPNCKKIKANIKIKKELLENNKDNGSAETTPVVKAPKRIKVSSGRKRVKRTR